MTIDNIIITENFSKEVNFYIKDSKITGNIFFVSTQELIKKHENKINELSSNNKNISIITLPQSIKNNVVGHKLLSTKVASGTCLIIVFGEQNVVNLVKYFCTQNNCTYLVIPACCESGNFATNYCYMYSNIVTKTACQVPSFVVIDESIVGKSSNKNVANCYAQMLSYYVNILDCVFCHVVYENIENTNYLSSIEKLLNKATNVPSNILKNEKNKVWLFYIKLQVEMLFNSINIDYFSCESVALLLQHLTDYKLKFGECLMVATLCSMAVLNGLNNADHFSHNYMPDYVKLNKLNRYYFNRNLQLNDEKDERLKNIIYNKYNMFKPNFLKLFNKYNNVVINSNFVFKNFYNDKSIFINKHINKKLVLNAFCMASQVYENKNYLEFLQCFGLLNFNSYSK